MGAANASNMQKSVPAKRTRPMVRAERRKQLMQIARQLVAEEGLGALTMTALSERAMVAKPVVYSHFANRQQVAIALLDEHFEILVKFVHERLGETTELDEYISQLVDASFAFEGSSDTPVQRITNGFSGDDQVNQAYLRHEEELRSHWVSLLGLVGVVPETIPVAAHALSGMVSTTVYTFAIRPDKDQARETLKLLVVNAVHALMPAGKQPGSVTGIFETIEAARVARTG